MKLTHWGRATHICVGKLNIIGSDNGLSPGRRQAIIWTNIGILLIRTLRTNFSEILSEIHTFSSKKMHLKMSSVKWRPFCLGLNVNQDHTLYWIEVIVVATTWPLWDVIIPLCPNCKLELAYGWVISSPSSQWMWLLTHAISLHTGSSVLDAWPLTRSVQDTMQVPHTHDRPISHVSKYCVIHDVNISFCYLINGTFLHLLDHSMAKPQS